MSPSSPLQGGDDRTEATARVADVLLHFLGGSETQGVSEIARDLGLSKAVVHRILRTLVDRDLLGFDVGTRRYRMGPAVAALGSRALRDSDLRRAALPILRDLASRAGETATVSALVADERVYLDQVISDDEIKMTVEIGRRWPLHAGSSGRAVLAFLEPAHRDRILAGDLPALTDSTIVDKEVLRERLAEVRREGLAFSGGERQAGAASVAAPVLDVDGHAIGALSVCGPVNRFNYEVRARLASALRAGADELSCLLGWRGGLPD
ncbi:IclR family transcriptional regulator [Streptomyces canus]|uniref:IclR family transcriptional regulator n=1 Tax=Streptomyces canus TaxID=58343 RepID=UPI0003A27FFC|nr:IclR family transcriptional regulator [Streptomyces canus]